MVTEPTRSIRVFDHPSIFDLSADTLLTQVTELQAQYDVPYLTVTMDWTVDSGNPGRREAPESRRSEPSQADGGSNRAALREYEQAIQALMDQHGPRGDTFDALKKCAERIGDWLQNDLDPAASGVYIVSHEPSGTFIATGLNMPVDTRIHFDTVPRLYQLVRLVEDHPTYAVLQADQENTNLSFVTRGARDRSVKLESTLYPRKQQAGAWNQKRYQRRADERVEAFARDTISEVDKALMDTGVDVLILAGSEVMINALKSVMPNRLKDIVFDQIPMESVVTPEEKIEITLPIAERAERQREEESVDRLKSAIGQGGQGVAGVGDVLRALQTGQADELIMCDTFQASGWGDYEMHVFGAGDSPKEHPAGGDINNIVEVDLRNELVRLALASGAKVDIIHSTLPVEDDAPVRSADDPFPKTRASQELEDMGGVGAVLRYTITGDAEPKTI